MKKKVFIFIIVILLISCSAIKERLAIKECKFSLQSVAPHSFTFKNLKLDFKIKGENPNKVDAVLDRLTYTFFVNDQDVFSGTTGKGIKIPSGKSTSFLTTITLEYSKIGEALSTAIKLQKASYKIKAKAYVNTIIGEISYPIELELKK